MVFYPLQSTSIYEFYQSGLRLEEYVAGLSDFGYPGGGVTDTSMRAFPSYAEAFKKAGLKFIAGLKLRLIYEMVDYEVLLYPQTETGYRQLLVLTAREKPAYNLEEICSLAEVAAIVKTNSSAFYTLSIGDSTHQLLRRLHAAFDRFYLGVEIYQSAEIALAEKLREFAAEHSLHCIAIPEVLYLNRNLSERYRLLQSIGEKREYVESLESNSRFLLGPQALKQLYSEAELNGTAELAESISFDPLATRGRLLRTDEKPDEKLKAAVEKELAARQLGQEYKERAAHELGIIESMGFADYFLIVADYVAFARRQDIKVGPGRGSAASSLVSYLLGITEVDPLRYDLVFERFLNPDRQSLPDIDIDFEDTKREEIIAYLRQRYGPERVATIITYSSLQPASALNAAGEALKIPSERIKRLTANLTPGASLAESLERSYQLKRLSQDPYYRNIISKALLIEGFPVNTSRHAAGVIISDEPLEESVPILEGTAGYEYHYLERMGFVKFDILGLSNLSFLREIETEIAREGRELPDVAGDLDNPRCYEVLNRLLTCDIFQLESRGMRQSIAKIQPSRFSDLVALIALYRPGPMENIDLFARNKQSGDVASTWNPIIAEILRPTYNVLLYQEQILAIVRRYAGLSAAEADNFRRAISKKDEKQLATYAALFTAGAAAAGRDPSEAQKVYELVLRFANYGFNKAHSVSYALITYRLLYYKTFFTSAFYRASIRRSGFDSRSAALYRTELTSLGYQLRRPLVAHSGSSLRFDGGECYLPLTVIRGLSADFSAALEQLISEPPSNLFDFFLRSAGWSGDAKIYRKLIDAGALDEFEPNREVLRLNLPELISFGCFGEKNNRIRLRPAAADRRQDYYLEFAALGAVLSFDLQELTSLKTGEDEMLLLIVSPLNLNNTGYQALSRDGAIDIFLERPLELEPYAIVAATGKLNKTRKRLFATSIRKENP